MNEKDNSFEILQYFNNALDELKINLPDKLEAAEILTKYYLKKIIQNPNKAYEFMYKLDNEVYKKIDWKENGQKYLGEELNIEHLFTWYREIQDWNDNGILLYFNELPRDEQRIKFEKNLVEEARKTLNNNYS